MALSLFLTVFSCTFFLSALLCSRSREVGTCQDPRRPPPAKPTASHPIPSFVEAWLRISRFLLITRKLLCLTVLP